MKRLVCSVLVLLMLPTAALAESLAVDLAAMPMESLVQLRLDVDREIASRAATDEEQTISVGGVVFRLLLVEVGRARDDMPGLGVILLANNAGSASMTPLFDLGVTVTHGSVPLETSWVVSDHFTSSSVSTSQTAVIRPGAVDMQVFLGFILSGEGDRVEITLSRNHTRAGEDPYCGTFVADLSAP